MDMVHFMNILRQSDSPTRISSLEEYYIPNGSVGDLPHVSFTIMIDAYVLAYVESADLDLVRFVAAYVSKRRFSPEVRASISDDDLGKATEIEFETISIKLEDARFNFLFEGLENVLKMHPRLQASYLMSQTTFMEHYGLHSNGNPIVNNLTVIIP